MDGEIIQLVVQLGFSALAVAGIWRVFAKAGQAGFLAVIPVYNMVVLARIAGRPGIYGVGTLIPILNLFAWGSICMGIADRFGKSTGYAAGLFVLSFIFFPMLGFGDAEYDA